MLGVALGVVLMPQLAGAKASGNVQQYSALLDWGLRIVVLLTVPAALGLLLFTQPLVAVLYHYGAFTSGDVEQTSLALMGYAAGLLGIVAIKVLAPGYYANQDIKTPVRIAIVVLVLTQLMNAVFVPFFHVAGLSMSIGLGAMLNAGLLLTGLIRRGTFRPEPGWGRFGLQVLVASALLAIYLMWGAQSVDWLALRAHRLQRIGILAAMLVGAAVIYLGSATAAGLNLRQFLRR
jgi:putative peptidoglycan lipid II flippase